MKVAFIHYHLKPGGVTTVLRHQLDVLSEGGEGLVISGSMMRISPSTLARNIARSWVRNSGRF